MKLTKIIMAVGLVLFSLSAAGNARAEMKADAFRAVAQITTYTTCSLFSRRSIAILFIVAIGGTASLWWVINPSIKRDSFTVNLTPINRSEMTISWEKSPKISTLSSSMRRYKTNSFCFQTFWSKGLIRISWGIQNSGLGKSPLRCDPNILRIRS